MLDTSTAPAAPGETPAGGPTRRARPARTLPSFPGGALPAREGRGRTAYIRVVAVLALVVSTAYLAWRTFATVDLAVWWVSVPLLLFEVHAFVGLCLFTFSLWDVDAQRPARRVEATDARIAVLIPTYNEGEEILLPTVAAAVALRPAHETWVLDDGNRPWVAALAARLGARYVARADRHHAKAGNINHALDRIEADFVAVLDADHVATPDLLANTLGYFDDPRVALVQTPQDFYNRDSFEHDRRSTASDRAVYHEQALFYRVLQAGKNRWGAAFWCGTGAVVRVAALREVGGIATETITEDIHTTVRLHRRGWKTVYHNEVLARGLAASNAAQYQAQRLRWGTGAMQVLRRENPLTVPGLTLPQRLAYAATILGWFDAWRSLGYLLIPIAVLLTGAVPIRARPLTFGLAFGFTFLLQQLALRLLGRGYHRSVMSTMFELVRLTPNLLATLTLVRPGAARFQVTAKGRESRRRRRQPIPRLLVGVAVASVVAALWFACTVEGLTPLRYAVPWAAYGAAFWLVVNLALTIYAIGRVRTLRYGAERRRSVRFATALPGLLAGSPCEVRDVSLTGARVVPPGTPAGAGAARRQADPSARPAPLALTIVLDGAQITLQAVVRSRVQLTTGQLQYGLEFCPGQEGKQARLALALFNAQIVPELDRPDEPAQDAPAPPPASAGRPPRRAAEPARDAAPTLLPQPAGDD
ncbi:MAG TPA: glycosyltransferase [Thermomicrobiales bacterium]|nr:glycosyltransferase [Thermomicrobiales bacterium]